MKGEKIGNLALPIYWELVSVGELRLSEMNFSFSDSIKLNKKY
jgi:hypothetical protein